MAKYVALIVAFALGLSLAGLAAARSQKDTYQVTASLKLRFEVPRPKGVPAGAAGLFTGKAVELANDKTRLTWKLTFSKLSGRAVAAHVHAGKRGKAGTVLVALCGPCRNGQKGSATISHAQLRVIRSGGAYVNVHTAKNAAGEIRGQLKSSGGTDDSTESDSTQSTTTNTTPYP